MRETDLRQTIRRIRWWYWLLLVVGGIFIIRSFDLQVISHAHYQDLALQRQLRQYDIVAPRGIIEAHDGDNVVPIVLNETLYTIVADPKSIQDITKTAMTIAQVTKGDAAQYEKSMRTNSRYVPLAKKVSKQIKDQISSLKLRGITTPEEIHRTYPQGDLAAQVLGFVNDDGQGKYGIEQYFDAQLKGKPGKLKAITDVNGVPLVANKANTLTDPVPGQQVVLTLDISMQRQLEDILKARLDAVNSSSGSALILDINTGAVKAMANFPTYSPASFFDVTDSSVFSNATVSSPLEIGSTMKAFTVAAAIDQGIVNKNTTYYDPGQFIIDGATVKNVEEDGGIGTRSISTILQLSLNTGATWLLMQMGGGQINEKARTTWNNYMVQHYRFGVATGIEQGYEAPGTIPDPIHGYGLNIQYANTAFGQGMTATPLQVGAALAALINGGTYYRPHLVDKIVTQNKTTVQQPDILEKNVIKSSTSQDIQSLLENVVTQNHLIYGTQQLPTGYTIGGKTGTAQFAMPGGGYYPDRFNGMFIGFVGGDKPQYVIVVRVNDPHISGYAGAQAAAPLFLALTTMLINNFGIQPKTH